MAEEWRLVEAPESLEQVSQRLSKELNVLEETFDTKVNTIAQSTKCNDEIFEVKMNTVNENVGDVKNEVETFKESVDSKLNLVIHSANTNSEGFHASINAVNQTLVDEKNEFVALKETFDEQMHTIAQTAECSSEIFDVKMNTVNKNLANAKNEFETFKESFNSKLNLVIQSAKTNNDNFDAKIKAVNKTLTNIETLIEEQNKRQLMTHLISCSHLNSFTYYFLLNEGSSYYEHHYSEHLVKNILEYFSIGQGFNLHATDRLDQHCDNDSDLASSQKEFRNKLVNQVELLIGHKPRLTDNKNGTFTIWNF